VRFALRELRPCLAAVLFVWIASAFLGCRHTGAVGRSVEPDQGTWVVFQVVQRGTGQPLDCFVWADGHQEDFETLEGESSAAIRFEGLGRTADGFAVTFEHKQPLKLLAWASGHELGIQELVPERGENRVLFELRKVEIEDERVPEEIRLEVPQFQPSEGPRTGS
jgi:hypothetical protein